MIVLNTKRIYDSSLPIDIIAHVRAWYYEVVRGSWASFDKLTEHYPGCSLMDNKVIFPIADNTYVITTRINFSNEVVLILEIQDND